MLALVDCNNFFVSCEKVFNPQLEGKAVVVLSSNDGCIIARSQEAKALGIPMGAPAFEYRALFKKYGVILLSSNFSLYLDMSRRVMQCLRQFAPCIEIYSVDEAFLRLVGVESLEMVALEIRKTVLQWTGIPVSVGIGATKTLAKVANHYAKKQGICVLNEANREVLLKELPVSEIWGIGRKLSEKLQKKQIYSAWQLAACSDVWLKKELTVTGLRMAWELRGTACLELAELTGPKKSISTARSFEKTIHVLDELLAILADYTAYVAEKLRVQASLAGCLTVWLDGAESSDQASYMLPEPTAYTPTLIDCAKKALKTIYRDGIGYKKVGVLLGNFVSEQVVPCDLFSQRAPERRQKEKKAMQLLDAINEKWGKKTLYFASQEPRKVRQQFCTPQYTTNWDELLLILL